MFDVAAQLLALAGPRPRIVVAFSGGVDSTVLAHALARARRKFGGLRLIHVDHGLQSASRGWAIACARTARSLGVPHRTLRANLTIGKGVSPEAAARDARYSLLAQAMQPGEVLVTAQHRDDQVETLLLQLLRGAGVAGLAAMPRLAVFGPGRIARPLLGVSRAAIESYAHAHRLRWIDDPSNADTRFDRNFLRQRVWPLVKSRWPGADAAIGRSAGHMAEAQELLASQARADLARLADGAALSVAVLRALPLARRRNAVRRFIAAAGIEVPESSRLNEIVGPMLAARADAQPEVRWGGVLMRRRAGRLELHVMPQERAVAAPETIANSWSWADQRVLVLNGIGDRLELSDDESGPIDLARLPATLEVRARRGGETLRVSARGRTQALKKLLQAARIAPEARARLPLLYSGNHLIAAGDRWIDASVAANVKSRRRARLVWWEGTDL